MGLHVLENKQNKILYFILVYFSLQTKKIMKHAKKQEHVTKSQENHSQQKQIHRQTLAVGLTDKKFKPTVINMLNKL